MRKRLLPALLALALILTLLPAAVLADSEETEARVRVEKVDDDAIHARRPADDETSVPAPVEEEADPDEVVRVSIVLEKPSTIAAGYSTANIAANASAIRYRDGLRAQQASVQKTIERDVLNGHELDVVWNMTLAGNIISANVRRGDIEEIGRVSGVKEVFEEIRYAPQVIEVGGEYTPQMAVSGGMNGTPVAWETGYTGAGTRIAIVDTGIDALHQSFDPDAFEYSIERWEEENGREVDLMTQEDVANVLSQLNIAGDRSAVTAEDLYLNSKVPFAYNYIDDDLVTDHIHDGQGEHGSHVAGIAAANRYIPVKDGNGEPTGEYVEALDTVKVAGNAPDAQLIILKVFGERGGAYESDYMVAIEDAIIMGADSINISLGSSYVGFARSSAYQEIVELIRDSDTILSAAAGNAGSWAGQTTHGQLYSDGVSFATTGSPSTFSSALSVASVENDGLVSTLKVGRSTIGYLEAQNGEKPLFPTLDATGNGTDLPYLYLDISTAGHEEEALAEIGTETVKGKVVVLWRGTTSFATKANAAAKAGALGVIIANNVANQSFYANLAESPDTGEAGYSGGIPVITVTRAAGEQGFKANAGEATTTTSGYAYSTGTLTVYGNPHAEVWGSPYTMSYFSSWGVTGSLGLKPEISAPGGNIWSVWGENTGGSPTFDADDHSDYELMSGTSMAAPQIAGLSAQVQQYVRDTGLAEATGRSPRFLTQSLLMSTAHPMKDTDGNYYPVLQQGSGIANVADAVSSPVYVAVPDQPDGKAKIELGEDPDKTGAYTFSFDLVNFSEDTVGYKLSLDLFTQAVSTQPDSLEYMYYDYLEYYTRLMDCDVSFLADDLEINEENLKADLNGDFVLNRLDAQLLMDHVIRGTAIPGFDETALDFDGDGDVDTHDVHALLNLSQPTVVVPAGGSATVTAVVTLTDAEREELAAHNPKGAFVEGFIRAESQPQGDGFLYPELSIPILGFYGSWTDPSMYERGTYTDLYNNYVDWYDYISYYGYAGVPDSYTWGRFTDFQWFYYPYNALTVEVDDAVPTSIEPDRSFISGGLQSNPYNSFSSAEPHMLPTSYAFALVRPAGGMVAQVTNHKTHEVYYRTKDRGSDPGAYVNGTAWTNNYDTISLNWDGRAMDGEVIPDGEIIDISFVSAPEYYAREDGTYDWDALTDGDPANGELGSGAYLTTSYTVDNEAPTVVDGQPVVGGEEGNRKVTLNMQDNQYVNYVEIYSNDGEQFLAAFGREYMTENEDGTVSLAITAWSNIFLYRIWDKAYNSTTYRVFVDLEPVDTVDYVKIYDKSTMKELTECYMYTGDSIQLYGAAYPIAVRDRGVTWESSNNTCLSVDENGLMTAHRSGDITVTARSKQDTTKTATLKVKVVGFDKELDVVSSSEKGNWLGTINTNELPDFNETLDYGDIPVSSFATNGKDLYAFTYTSDDEGTDIYKVDPETHELTKTAHSETPCMASTNNFVLGGYLLGISGSSVVLYDPNAGEGKDALVYSEDYGVDLAAIAYEGTVYKSGLFGGSVDIDVFYLIDLDGNIYEDMMYLFSDELHVYFGAQWDSFRNIGFSADTLHGSSAFFDGAFMYIIMNNSSRHEQQVIVWDKGHYLEGYRNKDGVFRGVGKFDTTKNLILGLYDFDDCNVDAWNNKDGSNFDSLTPEEPDAAESLPGLTAPVEPAPALILDAIDAGNTETAPAGDITVDPSARTVTVPVKASDSTNGDFTLTYDPDVLSLESLTPNGTAVTAFTSAVTPVTETDPETGAVTVTGRTGTVRVGFAEKNALTGAVATLVFSYRSTGETTLSLTVDEDGSDTFSRPEPTDYTVTLSVRKPSTGPSVPSIPSIPSNPSTPSNPSNPSDPGQSDTPEQPAFRFKDIPEDTWFTDAVYELYEAGIIEGIGEDKYQPNATTDRASVAMILWRIAGKPELEGTADFNDVAAGAWYAQAVKWASEAGYMIGTGNGNFEPDRKVTRQELVTVLCRYAAANGMDVTTEGYELPAFADLESVAPYALEAMRWAVKNGIIQGVSDNRLNPEGSATRAEIAVIISRFEHLK